MNKIPIYQPYIARNQKKYVNQCLDDNWISSRGVFVSKFEDNLNSYLGSKAVTTCSNGTVALHLALLALDIGPGDEVIVPSFTYVASVNAIRYVGAVPVFVDINKHDWNISCASISKKISKKTKAIMCVHIYGAPCDMNQLVKIAKGNKLFLIEDCAESFGTFYQDQHVGVFGDIATLSFFGNKTITTGEGGAVFSNRVDLIEKVAHLKNQGLVTDGGYTHDVIGYNYRMTNIQAAIGCAQLEDIGHILNLKLKLTQKYRSTLSKKVLFQDCNPEKSSNWINTILLEDEAEVKNMNNRLDKNNIEVRPGFPLVNKMICYQDSNIEHLSVSESISSRTICLPSYPDLSEDEQSLIISTVLDK